MRAMTWAAAVALTVLGAGAAGGEEWSFEVEPGERLTIDLETGGEVAVRAVAGSTVRVDAKVRGRDAETVRVAAERVSRGVRVTSEQTSRKRSTSASVDLTITVPVKFDLELDSMGGDLRVEGVDGKLSGQTMGGEVVLVGIRGTVDLKTMGGEIEVIDAVADGTVSTMGGDVRLKNVRGGLRGSTMGGDLRIEGGDAGQYSSEGPNRQPRAQSGDVVRISSMGGQIHVDEAPHGADVETMGGNIRVDSAKTFVRATTMGGNIDIREADGDVRATTMGGDVSVRVVGAGGDVELETMSGEVELTLPAGFSGSFDVELEITKNSRRSYEIRSDFPLDQRREDAWRYGEGTPRKSIFGEGKAGGGEHRVKIHVINGDVVIRKGS